MITEMQKIQIGALADNRDAVLGFLQEEEVVHITAEEPTVLEAAESETGYLLAQLQFALEFITRIRRELSIFPKKSWKNTFVSRPSATLPELNAALDALDAPSLIKEVKHTSDTLNTLAQEKQALQAEIEALKPWQSLHLTSEDLASRPKKTEHIFAHITSRQSETLYESLKAIPSAIWQEVAVVPNKKMQHIYIEIIAHVDDQQALTNALNASNADVITIALDNSSITDKLNTLTSQLQIKEQQELETYNKAKSFLEKEADVRFAYDALLHKQERELVSQKVSRLPHTFVITGWIPKKWIDVFIKNIQAQFPEVSVQTIEPNGDEKVPVLFTNKKFIQPFEAVTNIYGKPGYHELDPSGVLSIFFLLSFGLALTDAGYGLIMMLGTFLADRYFLLKRDMRKMVRLLFLGGAATFVLGALTGGWFGIALETLEPGPIRDFLLSIKLLDPITEPMKLLGVAFIIGITQLVFAWVVKAQYSWSKGDKVGAILDNFPWITMIPLLLAWVGSQKGILPASWNEALKWALYINIAVIVLTQGRSYKNPFLKIGGGVLSLFGLMSFLSDTLSYSRLLALGLATGIIGFVVNLLAGMAIEQLPYVGVVFAFGILIVGHTLNIGINTLGAFIHAGRLQFVEFFPKFLEGGGVAFRPFGRVSKYVDNPKEFVP